MSINTLSGQPRQGYGDPRERAKNFVKMFSYGGNDISFYVKGDSIYLNATEMAKVFGKRPVDFLRLESTSKLIKATVRNNHCDESQLVRTVNGGSGRNGTWLHEDIALDFAQWLSVDFKIWCSARLKELFGFGATFTQEKLEELLISPDTIIKLATQVKEAREEIARYQDIIVENEPKVKFAEAIEVSEDSLKVGELAKVLKQNNIDVGRNRLFKVLRDSKYLCSHKGEFNNPTQMSMNLGLFEVNVQPYIDLMGNTKISKTTVVTGKGIEYFVTRFKEGKIAV